MSLIGPDLFVLRRSSFVLRPAEKVLPYFRTILIENMVELDRTGQQLRVGTLRSWISDFRHCFLFLPVKSRVVTS